MVFTISAKFDFDHDHASKLVYTLHLGNGPLIKLLIKRVAKEKVTWICGKQT